MNKEYRIPLSALTPVKERVARHAEAMRKLGLIKISVWVPDDGGSRKQVHQLARRLRTEKGRPLPKDKRGGAE